jgi:hypothetical protein
MTLVSLPDAEPAEVTGACYAASNGFPPDGVTVARKRGMAYSMSMGDVVKIKSKYFLCLAIGWEEISEWRFRRLYHRATGTWERLQRAEMKREKARERMEEAHREESLRDAFGM